MVRILLIEDDHALARSVERLLDDARFRHETASSGEAALELARLYAFDAILLDLTLPDVSGFEVLSHLRKMHVWAPVLILSGNCQTAIKVSALSAGADDYITKPFAKAELVARLHALVRRSRGHARSMIVTGPISIDLAAGIVLVDDQHVALTAKEYAILEILALYKGMTVTREMIQTHLYASDDERELKTIDVFICKLRKKLADAGGPPSGCIKTLSGRGYSLRDPQDKPNTKTTRGTSTAAGPCATCG